MERKLDLRAKCDLGHLILCDELRWVKFTRVHPLGGAKISTHKERVSAMEQFLSNRDLVRALLSQSADGIRLLSTSNAIRTAEPCAAILERWAAQGCPEEPVTAAERRCLEGIGGNGGVFCSGLYAGMLLNAQLRPAAFDRPAAALLRKLMALLANPPVAERTHIVVSFAGARVSVRVASAEATLIVDDGDGRRFKGYPCTVTRDEALRLLAILLTRAGRVDLPCPTHPTSAIDVPRAIGIRVSRRVGGTGDEWLIMRARRR